MPFGTLHFTALRGFNRFRQSDPFFPWDQKTMGLPYPRCLVATWECQSIEDWSGKSSDSVSQSPTVIPRILIL